MGPSSVTHWSGRVRPQLTHVCWGRGAQVGQRTPPSGSRRARRPTRPQLLHFLCDNGSRLNQFEHTGPSGSMTRELTVDFPQRTHVKGRFWRPQRQQIRPVGPISGSRTRRWHWVQLGGVTEV
jgi:hypothetical protein